MRSTPILAKSIALVSFVVLMSGFVAYRSGAFDKYLYKGDGSRFDVYNQSDTSGKPDTIKPEKTIMAGSKAMVLSETHLFSKVRHLNPSVPADTAQFLGLYREFKRIKNEDSVRQHKEMIRMSSSKSMVIMKPEDLPENRYMQKQFLRIDGSQYYLSMFQVDSLLYEMKRVYPVNPAIAVPDTVKKTHQVMPSTKSGSIIRPKDIKQGTQ
jgi:hypothetical protein